MRRSPRASRRRTFHAASAAFCLFAAALVAPQQIAKAQQAKLFVTVFDEKTGEPVKDLQASNFTVIDDKTQLRVEGVEYKENLLDVMLLIDTSLLGEMVRPLGSAFVKNLNEDEHMAIVSYHSSADLIQDFTTSKDLLLGSLQKVNYGNNPRALDALFAAIDGGFQYSSGRRVIVLLSAGIEGRSRVSESEVVRLAREKNVAIYPVYVVGAERSMFRRLAQYSGGAYFGARKLKLKPEPLSDLVYSVVRGSYELQVSGVHTLGHRVQVKIDGLPKSDRKVWASARPIE